MYASIVDVVPFRRYVRTKKTVLLPAKRIAQGSERTVSVRFDLSASAKAIASTSLMFRSEAIM
jgi:hypothetical protein